MCNVCCQEFTGWCKAFTRIERLLTILEGILLVVFIGFLTFLILHLIVCPKQSAYNEVSTSNVHEVTDPVVPSTPRQTLASNVECTWKPSQKTEATTHYYEYGLPPISTTSQDTSDTTVSQETTDFVTTTIQESTEIIAGVEETDGEEPEEGFEKLVIALVKIKPLQEITFGCILTIVSEYWTLTAASCIEAIEEVDSLESFVLLEGYGAPRRGGAHAVAAMHVHPRYGGANRSHDLAALRSADALSTPHPRLRLPTMLDYLLLTIGERLTILGYGRFRTVETSVSGRNVREVHVYSLPWALCGAGEQAEAEGAGLRHLARPEALEQAPCEAGAICAGTLHARGLPCNYCAGTPLLAAGRLLGVMADNPQCGVSCEPTRYVNIAAMTDWIDYVIRSDDY